MILANRDALKHVSSFAVDAQFIQSHALEFFKYQGEESEEYKALKLKIEKIVLDALNSLQSINAELSA